LAETIERSSEANAILVPIEKADAADLKAAKTVVLGASIVYGKYRPAVQTFLEAHRELLRVKRTALFSVNVTARKPNRNTPECNPYMTRLLEMAGFSPDLSAVFAGKVDYPAYGPFDRFMIRLILRITKGPIDTSKSYEFTDWKAVEAFGRRIAAL
jgi:menaquinone-dependent protoporphyrinogen oxidase